MKTVFRLGMVVTPVSQHSGRPGQEDGKYESSLGSLVTQREPVSKIKYKRKGLRQW